MFNCSKAGGGGILPLFGLGGDSSPGGISTTVSESASIKKVVIEPPSSTIVENGTAEFTATAFYSDGSSKDVTSEVSWTSEGNAKIVTSQGNSTSKDSKQPDSESDSDSPLQPTKVGITGLKKGIIKGWPGTAKVKATLESVSGESNINVIASTDIDKIIFLDPPKLKPNSLFANIAKGANLPFYAIARLKTGKNLEVTNSVFWTVSDTSKGTFQTKGDLIGTFSALEDGIIWVQACFKDKFAEVCTEKLYLSISKNAIKSLSIEGNDKLVKGMNTKLSLIAFSFLSSFQIVIFILILKAIFVFIFVSV
jgi:hypothetical protein